MMGGLTHGLVVIQSHPIEQYKRADFQKSHQTLKKLVTKLYYIKSAIHFTWDLKLSNTVNIVMILVHFPT